MKIFKHLDKLDTNYISHDDSIFIGRLKRYIMNYDENLPDCLKVEGLETLTSWDMVNAGYTRQKFRFDNADLTWSRKNRELTIVDNPECREKVRLAFTSDDYSVFSDRTREVINYQGEELSARYLRNRLDVLARRFLAENPDFPGSLRSVKQIVHMFPFIKSSGASNRVHSTCGVHKRLELFCESLNKSGVFKTSDWTPSKLTRICCCPGIFNKKWLL